jgi:hypothetical protein
MLAALDHARDATKAPVCLARAAAGIWAPDVHVGERSAGGTRKPARETNEHALPVPVATDAVLNTDSLKRMSGQCSRFAVPVPMHCQRRPDVVGDLKLLVRSIAADPHHVMP